LDVVADDSGLQFTSLGKGMTPKAVSFLRLTYPALDVVLDDTLCYVADDIGGVMAVSVANSLHPWITAYYAAPGRVRAVALDRHRLIAVDAYSGLLELEFKSECAAVPPVFSERVQGTQSLSEN
jgi:hypothetical protein